MVLKEMVGGSLSFFLKSSACEAFQLDSGGYPRSGVAIFVKLFS